MWIGSFSVGGSSTPWIRPLFCRYFVQLNFRTANSESPCFTSGSWPRATNVINAIIKSGFMASLLSDANRRRNEEATTRISAFLMNSVK